MGWQLETKIENEETKYRIWSTVVDGWIINWSTREDVIKFLFWSKFQDFMYEFNSQAQKFPHMWMDKNTKKINFISDDEDMKLKKSNQGKTDADIFKEIISEMKIELSVKDSEGHYL